jgi:amidase
LQNPGQTTYGSSIGVMATSLDGIKLVLESVLSTKPWIRDPTVAVVPWRQGIVDETLARATPNGSANKPLKMGILWTDKIVAPHPPILRGLRITQKALLSAGHKTMDWDPPSHEIGIKIGVCAEHCCFKSAHYRRGHFSKPTAVLTLIVN